MRSILRACGALGVLALLWSAPAESQAPTAPRPGRREIPGLDISRDGAWRVRAREVKAARRAALARRDLTLLNGPSPAMAFTGSLKIPVVFLSYADTVVVDTTAIIGDTAKFRSVFFSATPQTDVPARSYSLKTYYEQLSNGNISIDGQLYNWVQTGKTFAGVGQNCAGVFCANIATIRANFGQYLKAGLDSLNVPGHQVDWGQFDNDGPDNVPNSGDDDGFVDFVTFIHPAQGAECGGPGGGQTGNHIWAHRWTLSSALQAGGYTTQTPRNGGGFIKINDYTIQSARGGTSGCSTGSIMPIGTLAHETGHAFGIPDLYATAGNSEGVGEWSLMGSGNYTNSRSPAAFDAWSLLTLGWVAVDTVTTSRSVTLNPVQTSDTVLVALLTGTDEYLILENRARLQSDTAQMDPSRPTSGGGGQRKDPGLLIWHIDQSIVDGGMNANTVNAGAIEGVRLVQADGLDDLHAGLDRGDAGDSYPGVTANHRLNYHSNPGSLRNDGTVAGFVIDSIFQVSDVGAMKFRFRRSAPTRITTNRLADFATVTVNGVAGTSYEDIFGLGDSITVSVADTQLINSGRTQLVFSSWSDAQARVHTIIADGTPDTVIATLNARHRVNFIANGTGTVGTSGPATNTFVDQGTTVTLTATPTGGAVFTNWTGDTTSSNASLALPMGRPFAVTANFTGAVAVSFDQATNDILGIANMTTQQRNFLDLQGNNNAVFDLGDYLAYLKANGLVVSPEVLARILTGPAPSKEQ